MCQLQLRLIIAQAPLDPVGIRQAVLTAFMADSLRRRTPLPTQGMLTVYSRAVE